VRSRSSAGPPARVGFLRTLTVIELDLGAAIAAGTLDGRLHGEGTPLGARDTLVATAAREHGYVLVTRDRDFEGISGLDVELFDEGA